MDQRGGNRFTVFAAASGYTDSIADAPHHRLRSLVFPRKIN
jgi:hypothetical protein